MQPELCTLLVRARARIDRQVGAPPPRALPSGHCCLPKSPATCSGGIRPILRSTFVSGASDSTRALTFYTTRPRPLRPAGRTTIHVRCNTCASTTRSSSSRSRRRPSVCRPGGYFIPCNGNSRTEAFPFSAQRAADIRRHTLIRRSIYPRGRIKYGILRRFQFKRRVSQTHNQTGPSPTRALNPLAASRRQTADIEISPAWERVTYRSRHLSCDLQSSRLSQAQFATKQTARIVSPDIHRARRGRGAVHDLVKCLETLRGRKRQS
jgi:hypothetical protein